MRVLQIIAGILLVVLFLVLHALPAASCCGKWYKEPPYKTGLHWREVHHGYLGFIALIPYWPVQVVALIPLVDDVVQHIMQTNRANRFAKSPLHRLAAKVGVI